MARTSPSIRPALPFSSFFNVASFPSNDSSSGPLFRNSYPATLPISPNSELLERTPYDLPLARSSPTHIFGLVTMAEGQVSFTRTELPLDPESIVSQPFKTVDLNLDGKLDLLGVGRAAGGHNQIIVRLGNGDGTFQPAKVTDVPIEFEAEFATGYINRDGFLDLIAAGINPFFPSTTIFVCLGIGDGTFTCQTFEHSAGITSITAGDFTNNGTNALDVVVSDTQNRIALYPGNFDGTFQSPIYTQLPGTATKLHNINLQRVGVPDLAFVMNGVANIWKNDGGQFSPFRAFSPGTGNIATDAIVADANGDTQPDLLVPYQHGDSQTAGCGPSDSCSGLKVFYNDGAGNFVRYDAIYATTYTRISRVAVGDFNQDGINDLAMFADRKSDDVLVLLGKGNGSFNAPQRITGSGRGLASQGLASGDFNGDGKIDIITTSAPTGPDEEGSFALFTNTTPEPAGACSRPDSPGVHICTPAADSNKISPVHIVGAGTNEFPTYSMLVWLDGVRRYEAISTRVDTSQKVSPGYHRLAVESFFFGASQGVKAVENFTTPCPNAAAVEGINICSPVNGSTVSSPVKAQAFVKLTSGAAIYRFELWVDGVKKVSVGSTGIMDTSVALGLGGHKFEFVLRRTDGSRTVKTVFATVH